MPNLLAASCCCGDAPPCGEGVDFASITYSGLSLSQSTTCTRTCDINDSVATLNCVQQYRRSKGLQINGGTLNLTKGNKIRELGWYSESWLKGGNMMLRDVKWPRCGARPCKNPKTGEWQPGELPYNGTGQRGSSDTAYYVYTGGRAAEYGNFGRYTYNNVNPACREGLTNPQCWDCVGEGDVVSIPYTYQGLSPIDLTIASAKLTCLNLGGGKTAWSGHISFNAPGTHARRFYQNWGLQTSVAASGGCCDHNGCECNGQLGCGRSGPEFWCFDREGGGVFNVCDFEAPCDYRCMCECEPYAAYVATCFDTLASRRCLDGSNCACNESNPGTYDGCCWGLGNGYDSGAGPGCQQYRDHYGLPYANCFCPQEEPSYWCYGPTINNSNNCTQASQIQSCHPACGNDLDDYWGTSDDAGVAQYVSCQNPSVGWGKIVGTYRITINPDPFQGDVPYCYGCTAAEYFDMFSKDEYVAIGTFGNRHEIKVQ